jgi:dCMP deaminase
MRGSRPVRPDRDEWHLEGANWLAKMGDCTRRKVGALIVGPDKRFWGMGYNGSYPGGPSCLEGDCPRGRHYRKAGYADYDCPTITCFSDTCVGRGHPGVYSGGLCACGNAWPCPDAVAPGSSYDTGPGACIASHAEANAVADAMQRSGGRLAGCVMYVNAEPCEGCIRHIRNTTDIECIIWKDDTHEGVVALP